MAEIYEGELQDYAGAIANYERAADYYKGEDSTGSVGRERSREKLASFSDPSLFLPGEGPHNYRDEAMALEGLETVLLLPAGK